MADRVTFQARDAADPSLSGQHDLAVIVDALHDTSRPVDMLAIVRRLLAPGGTLIVADERVADAFHAPAGDTERLLYGYSVLDCLPAGMVSKPSAEPAPSCGDRPWSAMPRQRGSRWCRSCPSRTTSCASTGSTRSGSRRPSWTSSKSTRWCGRR